MLKFLSKIIINKPIKTIAFGLIMILIFSIGSQNVRMATGNDTLIRTNTSVYQNNLSLESEFGGESILVLFEGKDTKDLLNIKNLQNMMELENSLKHYDEIYSIVSPVTILHQASENQYEKYKDGIKEVADGLNRMGLQLKEVSNNLLNNSSKQSSLPNMDKKMKDLNLGLEKMIQGQEKLKEGTSSLVKGYSNFGTQLKEVAVNLENFNNNLKNSPIPNNQKQQQINQLHVISTQLLKVSQTMTTISENSKSIPTVPEKTISGLEGIENGLNSQMSELNKIKDSQTSQLKNLNNLGNGLSDMGDHLLRISSHLKTMVSYSDSVTPSIPRNQRTLNKMAYDDKGNLRSMFDELIIDDEYMVFMVKLKGNIDDSTKTNIVNSINEFLDENSVESIKTIVSGKPVLDNAIRSSMKNSMKKMMGLSGIFMVAVLLIIFRVRWRLLPLITILIAVVGTVGLMGWLNIPVTMVSMAVFPILIGLGIDYAIQFQSRYVEEMEVEEKYEE